METNWNQLIERYVMNELSAEGKQAFEDELAKNSQLQTELELHQMIHEGAKRAAQRSEIQQIAKRYKIKKTITTAGIVILMTGVLAAAILWLNGVEKITTTDTVKTPMNISPAVFEKIEAQLPFDHIEPVYFEFSGKDSAFISPSGVLLSVTDESFLLNGKRYTDKAILQWQEAQDAIDIVKAGLETKSGNDLLETQGMFSLLAFTPKGEKLEMTQKAGVYVQVPVAETKKGMQLFDGEKRSDGRIDWVNPTPLEKIPVPVDMSMLNFYPPGYEPKLDELKWFKSKKKRDSLYVSFEAEEDFQGSTSNEQIVQMVPEPISETKPKINNFPLTSTTIVASGKSSNENGKLLYEAKCATCHALNRDGTGPNLYKVREKWSRGSKQPNAIYRWVVDWQQAATSDPFAYDVAGMKGTAMNAFPELKGKYQLINAIFDYIDGVPPSPVKKATAHIPPSKVLAIWQPKFNNTLLATKDFEKRLMKAHELCSEKIFNVYVQNLNQPLWKSDEEVVKMGYASFQSFADERVGGIQLSNPHMNNLRHFYESATNRIKAAGKSAFLKEDNRRKKWDAAMNRSRNAEVDRTAKREMKNFQEEYAFNLKNVAKQLGNTIGFSIHGGGGPKNIDAYVYDATKARTSTIITDPNTGKTAKITYLPFTVGVKEATSFGKLYAYVFSKQMHSYERIIAKNGFFDYNLNGDMRYDIAIIGINEKGTFMTELHDLNTGNFGTLSLDAVSENEFEKRIQALNQSRIAKPMQTKDELKWLFKEQKNFVEQKRRTNDLQFRNTIRPTVFPCLKNKNVLSDSFRIIQ